MDVERPGQSDMDFLVEFDPLPPGGYADAYFGLLESLEALCGSPVDLVVASAIRNPFFPGIGRANQNPALCGLKRRSIFTISSRRRLKRALARL
jgi:hypothetical protein